MPRSRTNILLIAAIIAFLVALLALLFDPSAPQDFVLGSEIAGFTLFAASVLP